VNGIGTLNPIRYRGYYYDAETGLYYLRARYYDPTVGRFINADDIQHLGSGDAVLSYNLCAYCENSPTNLYDPNGTKCICSYQRVHSNHECFDFEQDEFAELYLAATGREYDFNMVTSVQKSTTEVTELETIGNNIIINLISTGLGNAVSVYLGPTIGTSVGILFGALSGSSLMGSGTYPTYTVTKSGYRTHSVEVANYHGYRVSEERSFKYMIVEVYYFMNGDIAKKNEYYYDEYLQYKYRGHN